MVKDRQKLKAVEVVPWLVSGLAAFFYFKTY